MSTKSSRSARKALAFLERPICPVCASREIECQYDCAFADPPISDFLERYYKVDSARFGTNRYRVDRCRACTLVFQRWVGDSATLAELYGEWIAHEGKPETDELYQRDIARPEWSRDAHELLTVARFLGKSPTDLRVLDYGLGWSLWARIAKSLRCKVAGVEMSPDRRAFAESHGIQIFTDEEIGKCQFDFINTDQVMEHVVNPGETCRRLAAALVPGGVLKVSVPNGAGAQRVIARLKVAPATMSDAELMPIQPLEHVNCFNDRSVEALGHQAGLKPVIPSLEQRFTFAARPSALPRRPKQLLKELIRPFYTFRNSANLYRWLRKDPVDRGSQ